MINGKEQFSRAESKQDSFSRNPILLGMEVVGTFYALKLCFLSINIKYNLPWLYFDFPTILLLAQSAIQTESALPSLIPPLGP